MTIFDKRKSTRCFFVAVEADVDLDDGSEVLEVVAEMGGSGCECEVSNVDFDEFKFSSCHVMKSLLYIFVA